MCENMSEPSANNRTVGGLPRLVVIGVAVVAWLATACTTMRPVVPLGTYDEIRLHIRTNEIVRVLTRAGASHTFRIAAINPGALIGTSVTSTARGAEAAGITVEIPYDDIARLDVRQFSVAKTTVLVVVSVLVVVGVVIGASGVAAAHGAASL
jgi:hypothetical protein